MTFREAARTLGRDPRDVRTLVLAHRIPTVRVGRAYALDDAGFAALRAAFVALDREAAARRLRPAPV